jgi:hypothetical protein
MVVWIQKVLWQVCFTAADAYVYGLYPLLLKLSLTMGSLEAISAATTRHYSVSLQMLA